MDRGSISLHREGRIESIPESLNGLARLEHGTATLAVLPGEKLDLEHIPNLVGPLDPVGFDYTPIVGKSTHILPLEIHLDQRLFGLDGALADLVGGSR